MKVDGNLIALYVLSKKPVIRYGVVAVLLAFVFIVWLQLIYMPLTISTAMRKKIFNQLEVRLNSIQTETTTLALLNKEMMRLQSDVKLFGKGTDIQYLQEKLFALISTIKNHHLTLIAWQPEPVRTKTWYIKQRVSCSLQGSFEQFMSFFSELTKQDSLLQCTQLIFEKQGPLLRAHCLFDYIFIQGDVHE